MKNKNDLHIRSLQREVEILKKTTDNWCPNYRVSVFTKYGDNGEPIEENFEDYVSVSFCKILDDYIKEVDRNIWAYSVVITGLDDTMVRKDFESELDAWNCFLNIIRLEFVDFDILNEMDFES